MFCAHPVLLTPRYYHEKAYLSHYYYNATTFVIKSANCTNCYKAINTLQEIGTVPFYICI